MKLLFLCSSLEPGKDGVGDYTRRLSAELIKSGYDLLIIALQDRYIYNLHPIFTDQKCDGTDVKTIRFSFTNQWSKKTILIKEIVENFKPDWISLQYVPYGFQSKGLPIKLPSLLSEIAGRSNWHIMFHEMWVGISSISLVKHKLVGFFQKKLALLIVKKINPKLITTSNILYKSVLENAGIASVILPLFSNIPIAKHNSNFLSRILKQLEINDDERYKWKFIGIFGSLYPEANLVSTLEKQYFLAKDEDKKLAFIAFGRINENGKKELERLQHLFAEKIKFLNLGEQSQEKVSLLLQLLDYGISCTPAQHSGKSGVYAAMKLHCLPVLLPAYEYLPDYDAIIKNHQSVIENREPFEWSVQFIATQFAHLLSSRT